MDVLNFVYRDSWDERVLAKLSERLKDRYDLFGGLPDVIEDEWIEDVERYEEQLDALIERHEAADAFELRYGDTVDVKGEDWALCAEVLARSGLDKALAKPW